MALITTRLRAYLKLEEAMLDLDEAGDPLADSLRDSMDPLWYALTDAEHAFLDARQVAPQWAPALTNYMAPDASGPLPTEVPVLAPMKHAA